MAESHLSASFGFNAEKDPRLPGFADCQMLAIARHAETGQVHCLVGDARSTTIRVMPEADAISAGHQLIDAILWSTETAADDGLDPALLA